MTIVLDASFVLAALSPDEADEHAIEVIETSPQVSRIVPHIWQAEIANVLIGKIQSQGMPENVAKEVWTLAMAVSPRFITIAAEEIHNAVFPLALRHRLTSYDALYLHLAKQHGAMLATFDRALIKAATTEKIELA
ncbi:MAG: type II toxin-antitoxin system VapC family toxin [Beijerinckiaceae bacterium]